MKYSVIISIVLFVACIIFFFIVCCIDPGIIPRPNAYERSMQCTDVTNYISSKSEKAQQMQPPFEQTVTIDGNVCTLKYCHTCKHFRGPRSFHCNNCDSCIERFDHHCPWLGNCVARRNYHFYIFIVCFIIIF